MGCALGTQLVISGNLFCAIYVFILKLE